MYLGGGIETGCYFLRGFVGLTDKPTFAIELPKDFDEAVFFLMGEVSFQLDTCFTIPQKLVTFVL